MTDPFAAAASSAARLAELTGQPRHDLAVVLGSGWSPAADALASGLGATVTEVPVADLGGFPPSTVPGHAGLALSMVTPGLRLLALVGRVHLYEGHQPSVVVHGVRTAVAAGCRVVALTNAAGGIAADFQVGQPVLVRDHLNLTGRSPLAGPGAPPEGSPSRFTDLTDLYSARLRGRPQPGRGGVRGHARAALRDARRDPDARHPGRRPGRHVHRAGSDRGPPP